MGSAYCTCKEIDVRQEQLNSRDMVDVAAQDDADLCAVRDPHHQLWTKRQADALQESVGRIFGVGGEALMGLAFSFTIADPFVDGCPLIGCSTGFTELTGHTMQDIVGHNCRFLVDPVPSDQIDQKMRKHVKSFCEEVKSGKGYQIPESEVEPWMPKCPPDEFLCMQRNARKDGSLFNNMFFLKVFELSVDLGEEKPYIVGLQSELKEGKEALAKLSSNLSLLQTNMEKVKKELSQQFFTQCSLSRYVGS